MLDGEDKLIRDAVMGEASAFGLLYDHYHAQIYRFVFVKVSQREEAEDLTHQVFLHAWQNIERYRDMGFPFSSWLYRIARNQIIDHYRTRKAHVPLEDTDHESFATAPTTEKNLDQTLSLERIKAAVQKLKPEYQDIILMRFVEDLSVRETAHALGKTEGAVKLMQHRAMKALKLLLKASFPYLNKATDAGNQKNTIRK